MDQWGNQRGNFKKSRGKWKWKCNVPNLWDAAKQLWEAPVVVTACIKKQERSQISILTLYLKELEKKEPTKPKVSKRK